MQGVHFQIYLLFDQKYDKFQPMTLKHIALAYTDIIIKKTFAKIKLLIFLGIFF